MADRGVYNNGDIYTSYPSPNRELYNIINDLAHPQSLKNDLRMLRAISCDLQSPPGPVTEFQSNLQASLIFQFCTKLQSQKKLLG